MWATFRTLFSPNEAFFSEFFSSVFFRTVGILSWFWRANFFLIRFSFTFFGKKLRIPYDCITASLLCKTWNRVHAPWSAWCHVRYCIVLSVSPGSNTARTRTVKCRSKERLRHKDQVISSFKSHVPYNRKKLRWSSLLGLGKVAFRSDYPLYPRFSRLCIEFDIVQFIKPQM